jgi:hypothetical protein
MHADQMRTAVEVFPDRSHAEYAVEQLRRHGFRDEQIGFLTAEPDAVEPPAPIPGTKTEEGAATGAVAGAAVGGLVGAALATLAIPGIGAVIAGGLMAGVLGGAATGLAGGGIVGALIGLNIPEDDAHHYVREFHSGRTLVTVRADERYDEAERILREAADKALTTSHAHRPDRMARLAEEEEDAAPGAGTAFGPQP